MSEFRIIPLPLSTTQWALLHASFPLTLDEFDRLLLILQAMKPAIVAASLAAPHEPPQKGEE